MTMWRCPYCHTPLLTMSQRLLHVADPRGCALRPSGTDSSKHLAEPCGELAGEHAVDDLGRLRVGYAHHPEGIGAVQGRRR